MIVTGEPTLLGELTRKKISIGANVVVDFHETTPTDEGAMLNLELMYAITHGRRPVPLRGHATVASGKRHQLGASPIERATDGRHQVRVRGDRRALGPDPGRLTTRTRRRPEPAF